LIEDRVDQVIADFPRATAAGKEPDRAWLATAKGQAPLKRHIAEVYSAPYSPDDMKLASGSNDQTIKLSDGPVANKVEKC